MSLLSITQMATFQTSDQSYSDLSQTVLGVKSTYVSGHGRLILHTLSTLICMQILQVKSTEGPSVKAVLFFVRK